MKDLFEQALELGNSNITALSVLFFFCTLVATWLLATFLVRLLSGVLKRRDIEYGQAFAIKQLVRYAIYAIGLVVAFQALGLPLAGLITISSALLIGVGIGLQQIFNDLFSGLIILFEQRVKKGDWVDINGMVGRVDAIKLRTSMVTTLDNIVVIVPNSKLISDHVINWSANRGVARFTVEVSVAYGTDLEKVKELLIHCAQTNEKVLKSPEPAVFFEHFGNNGLELRLLFWSKEFREVEFLKSQLRFAINRAFQQNNIEIPYQQVDVRMKSAGTPTPN